MKNVFIDCGFHHGEGLTHFIDMLGIDQTWDVHCFEPNPECHMIERLTDLLPIDFGNNVFPHESAVWIADGETDFTQENWEISNSGSPKNPCPLDGWASCIAGLNKAWPGLMTPIKVPCIDFSAFVERFGKPCCPACEEAGGNVFCGHPFHGELPPDECEIYCKMDIEGAEFAVLRKMLKDGTVKYLKKLWVEFHERYIPGENRQTKAALIRELSLYTEVEEWH